MAALTPTTMQGGGQRTGTPNTLTAADTFTYVPNTGQLLLLYNPTGGTITPKIRGTDTVNITGGGLGDQVLNPSQMDVAVPTLETVAINLDESRMYLTSVTNTVNITAGTSLIAVLLNP